MSVHRNDTVGQVIPEAVLKRPNSSGNRKIHLAFTDLVRLAFEIIQQNIILKINQLCFAIEASTAWSVFTVVTGI
jgi:hypothetical protein